MNSRFEILRIVSRTQRFQGLLDLPCPRERRASQHAHHALLPSSRLRVVAFNLHAQIAQLFQRGLACVVSIRPNVPRERGDALQREVLSISGDERDSCSG